MPYRSPPTTPKLAAGVERSHIPGQADQRAATSLSAVRRAFQADSARRQVVQSILARFLKITRFCGFAWMRPSPMSQVSWAGVSRAEDGSAGRTRPFRRAIGQLRIPSWRGMRRFHGPTSSGCTRLRCAERRWFPRSPGNCATRLRDSFPSVARPLAAGKAQDSAGPLAMCDDVAEHHILNHSQFRIRRPL
jgi:hypothetical protein